MVTAFMPSWMIADSVPFCPGPVIFDARIGSFGSIEDSTMRFPGASRSEIEVNVPAGTFTSISDLLAPGKRIVLSSIEPNEPILASKITGPGQKGTLSAIIQDGMKAVTIRVNDVDGVAGFVLPGDHVDVLVTRQSDKMASATDVVLQNIRVLAIDQIADAAADKPTVAKAVTLEVDTGAAQRLSLAGSIGALSLALRKAGEQTVEGARRVTVMDLDSPYLTARPIQVETKS